MYTMGMAGRKWEIFEAAVTAFSQGSFEGVSIRDIARLVDIRSSSVYFYFKSKQEILDTAYGYLETFYEHIWIPQLAEVSDASESGDRSVELLNQQATWPEEEQGILRHIMRIVISRMHYDQRARDIYKQFIDWPRSTHGPIVYDLAALHRLDGFDIEAYLTLRVALDAYATLCFTQNEPLPDDLWKRAGNLLSKLLEDAQGSGHKAVEDKSIAQ